MYTIITFPGGRPVDALLLSASPDRMRLVIRGRADTEEFHLIEGRWLSASGARVELAALIAHDLQAAARVQANACPCALAAC